MEGMRAANLIEQLANTISRVGDLKLIVKYDGRDPELPGKQQFFVTNVSPSLEDDAITVNVVYSEGV